MRILTTMAIACLGFLFMNTGCGKEDESIDPNQCIRATVVNNGSCGGILFVQVHNARIGTSWGRWDNVIAVNLPNTIQRDSTISFTLQSKSKGFEDSCNGEYHICNTNITIPENHIFCVKNISAAKCSLTDEK